MERKELLRFDQHEYDYQIKRCEAFCDTLNQIYINLCADYPEDSIKANIADIQSCVDIPVMLTPHSGHIDPLGFG